MENNYNNIDFNALMDTLKSGSKASSFSDGFQSAMIVGCVTNSSDFKNEKTGLMEPKIRTRFILQTYDEDGNIAHLQSQAMGMSMNEKASLRKFLESYTKIVDPVKIGEKLVELGIVREGRFSFENFLGLQVQASISVLPSKNDPTKIYPKVNQLFPAKKSLHDLKVPATIPDFMVKDALSYKLIDGITVYKKQGVAETQDDFIKSLENELN